MAILEAFIKENYGIVQQNDLHKCLDGVAEDSTNPQNVMVSASLTAQQSHSIENGESFVFRRSAEGEKVKGYFKRSSPIQWNKNYNPCFKSF